MLIVHGAKIRYYANIIQHFLRKLMQVQEHHFAGARFKDSDVLSQNILRANLRRVFETRRVFGLSWK